MKLIAHRGIYDNKIIIENTYESIKNALDNKEYGGVEFDIRTTKDNVFVVYHNPTFNNKLIKNTKYSELPKYVPKLETILKINTDKIFLIEIKNIDGNIDRFFKLLSKYKNKNIYLMSFNSKLINKLCKINSKYKYGVLNYILNTEDISCLNFVCILDSLIDKNLINTIKSKNKEIFSYGIINNKNIGLYDIYYIV